MAEDDARTGDTHVVRGSDVVVLAHAKRLSPDDARRVHPAEGDEQEGRDGQQKVDDSHNDFFHCAAVHGCRRADDNGQNGGHQEQLRGDEDVVANLGA